MEKVKRKVCPECKAQNYFWQETCSSCQRDITAVAATEIAESKPSGNHEGFCKFLTALCAVFLVGAAAGVVSAFFVDGWLLKISCAGGVLSCLTFYGILGGIKRLLA